MLSFNGANHTFNNSILVSGGGRIYQQSNANNSLNHYMPLTEQNFCITKSNRNNRSDSNQIYIYINLNDF